MLKEQLSPLQIQKLQGLLTLPLTLLYYQHSWLPQNLCQNFLLMKKANLFHSANNLQLFDYVKSM